MRKRILYCIAISLSVMMLTPGCRIKNAPGAYAIAYDRVTVENMEEKESRETTVIPTPEPVVREGETDDTILHEMEEEQETVEEQEIVPRVESFEIVEGQGNVELKTYHVVIGSFGKHSNALNLQADMRPDYQPVLVVNERGMYRVLLISYDTYAEAKNKIKEIKNEFPDAWVLIQKKQ